MTSPANSSYVKQYKSQSLTLLNSESTSPMHHNMDRFITYCITDMLICSKFKGFLPSPIYNLTGLRSVEYLILSYWARKWQQYRIELNIKLHSMASNSNICLVYLVC